MGVAIFVPFFTLAGETEYDNMKVEDLVEPSKELIRLREKRKINK